MEERARKEVLRSKDQWKIAAGAAGKDVLKTLVATGRPALAKVQTNCAHLHLLGRRRCASAKRINGIWHVVKRALF